MRDSVRYQRELEAAQEFREAFEAYTETQTYPTDQWNLGGEWTSYDGKEDEAERLREKLDRGAARLGTVAAREGLILAVQPPAMIGGPTLRINPALNWSIPYDPGSFVRVSDVRGLLDRMIGVLEHKRDEAIERERSLAGRIARVLRFPVEVREAMGASPKSVGGVATVGFGYFVYGTAIAAIGGVLAVVFERVAF